MASRSSKGGRSRGNTTASRRSTTTPRRRVTNPNSPDVTPF